MGLPSLKRAEKNGFTLIEVLVSVGVVAIIGQLVVQTFITTTRSNTKTEFLKDVKQNGDFALSDMGRLIQNANEITSCTVATPSSSSLVITNEDLETVTFSCYNDGGIYRIAAVNTTSGTTDFLTSENLTLDSTRCSTMFTCEFISSRPAAVNISFRLQQTGVSLDPLEIAHADFQSKVNLRNFDLFEN